MLGYVMCSMIFGTVVGITLLIYGSPVWIAIAAYSASGTALLLSSVFLKFARQMKKHQTPKIRAESKY